MAQYHKSENKKTKLSEFAVSSTTIECNEATGKKMCDAWLRSSFLNIGAPCTIAGCHDLHEFPKSSKLLIKDQTFLMLSKFQQNTISAFASSESNGEEQNDTSTVVHDAIEVFPKKHKSRL